MFQTNNHTQKSETANANMDTNMNADVKSGDNKEVEIQQTERKSDEITMFNFLLVVEKRVRSSLSHSLFYF
jgi:hypothetical protein